MVTSFWALLSISSSSSKNRCRGCRYSFFFRLGGNIIAVVLLPARLTRANCAALVKPSSGFVRAGRNEPRGLSGSSRGYGLQRTTKRREGRGRLSAARALTYGEL